MADTARRSHRQKKPNSRYSGTQWDRQTLRALRESSESSGSSPSEDSYNEKAPGDEDFGIHTREAEAAVQSMDEDSALDISPGSAARAPIAVDHADFTNIRYLPDGIPRNPDGTFAAGIKRSLKHNGTTRSQGLASLHKPLADWTFDEAFGPEVLDLGPSLYARDRWLKARDITIPSRLTLSQSIFPSNECEETGKDLPSRQDVENTTQIYNATALHGNTLGQWKSINPRAREHSVVLGPMGKQKPYTVGYLRTLDVSNAWLLVSEVQGSPSSLPATSIDHRGWIVNVGGKLQCLAWLSASDQNVQCLALVAEFTPEETQTGNAAASGHGPTSHTPVTASSMVQIWEFDCLETAKAVRVRSGESAPMVARLRSLHLLETPTCMVKWQPPVATQARKMLAVLSTRGHVEIISIDLTRSKPGTTQLVEVKSFRIAIRPPSASSFTSLNWLSSQDLIVGDAEGSVHVYDIGHADAQPYLSFRFHNISISAIISTQPSEIPTLIATTSRTGDIRLTDLRAPHQDAVHVRNSSPTKTTIAYCPLTRSFAMSTNASMKDGDRNATARIVHCRHIRRFLDPQPICSLPETSGSITTIATSAHHPCILIGTRRGSLYATNYLRTTLPIKSQTAKTGGFLQKMFDYDWRPLSSSEIGPRSRDSGDEHQKERSKKSDMGTADALKTRLGVSRFIEGFVPEPVKLFQQTTQPHSVEDCTSKEDDTAAKAPEAAAEEKQNDNRAASTGKTIFEDEQGMTALEWNPNINCAGWVAMGWGSGIVRVMDLSHDAD